MQVIEKKHLHAMLDQGVQDLQLSLPNTTLDQLINYLILLNKWNQVYNLTAIKDPTAMLTRHILDSLSIANYLGEASSIIDVGTGAGLPGIPLALCLPEKQFTLLDSNSKKTRFLIQAAAELHIKNVTMTQSRVESLQNTAGFDCILTRAFAPLGVMITLTQHLCRPSGRILAMCGAHPRPEELEPITDWSFKVYPLQVPKLREQRHLVILERKQGG